MATDLFAEYFDNLNKNNALFRNESSNGANI